VTVTLNVAAAAPPSASLALHFTVVAPIANVAPDAGRQEKVESVVPDAAVALAEYVTVAPEGPVAGAVMLAGTVIVGAVTVTVNVAVAVLPAASVAVQVTVVVPFGKVEPDGGTQVTGTVPSTMSVAVGSA
jgi:hypothetical protein